MTNGMTKEEFIKALDWLRFSITNRTDYQKQNSKVVVGSFEAIEIICGTDVTVTDVINLTDPKRHEPVYFELEEFIRRHKPNCINKNTGEALKYLITELAQRDHLLGSILVNCTPLLDQLKWHEAKLLTTDPAYKGEAAVVSALNGKVCNGRLTLVAKDGIVIKAFAKPLGTSSWAREDRQPTCVAARLLSTIHDDVIGKSLVEAQKDLQHSKELEQLAVMGGEGFLFGSECHD